MAAIKLTVEWIPFNYFNWNVYSKTLECGLSKYRVGLLSGYIIGNRSELHVYSAECNFLIKYISIQTFTR